MRRSSSSPDSGSALIEAVVIGSFVFIVVTAALSAAIDVSLVGGTAGQSVRTAAVHAARHSGPEAARTMVGDGGTAVRTGDVIEVVETPRVLVPHPDGLIGLGLVTHAEMPLAPYRSDRG